MGDDVRRSRKKIAERVTTIEYGLSLGSNTGDRIRHLRKARAAIRRLPGAGIVGCSAVYETEPVDVPARFAGKKFLNAVVVVRSSLTPEVMAKRLLAIERACGRRRSMKNAPRSIDIDMVYAGCVRLRTSSLTIPHPRWASRRFVVEPLAELRPSLVLPGKRLCVKSVLDRLPVRPAAVVMASRW